MNIDIFKIGWWVVFIGCCLFTLAALVLGILAFAHIVCGVESLAWAYMGKEQNPVVYLLGHLVPLGLGGFLAYKMLRWKLEG